MPVPELPLRETKFGLVADGDGWFVLNARDSRWRDAGRFGHYCDFEGKRPFRQLAPDPRVRHAPPGRLARAGLGARCR